VDPEPRPLCAHAQAPLQQFAIVSAENTIRFSGDLRIADAAAIWREVRAASEGATGSLTLDVAQVGTVDGSVMALLVELRAELAARGVVAELVGASDRLEPLIDLYSGHEGPTKRKKRKPVGTIEQVGRATVEVGQEAKGILGFFGGMVMAASALVRRPSSGHWKEVPHLAERCGADAVPIVVLINFLVGFVMAFQSAKQLKTFGANIFVADLVGISLTRELAPLMTAIIVCGRSGAAFAAELGSMKVNDEVDALRTLGLTPFGWLVVPRVIALVLVVPILTLLADFIGIVGGLVVGITNLDLSVTGYLIETQSAVHGWDVGTGLVKSVVFALAIGIISCQQGFAASGGAEGVGKRTTSTVVTALFALVIIDSLFTILFRAFDV
jgi:phospholipid/cholesterol/gamma-HCH transport system permease protein